MLPSLYNSNVYLELSCVPGRFPRISEPLVARSLLLSRRPLPHAQTVPTLLTMRFAVVGLILLVSTALAAEIAGEHHARALNAGANDTQPAVMAATARITAEAKATRKISKKKHFRGTNLH